MKTLLMLALILQTNMAFAELRKSPFDPKVDQRFDESEDAIDALEANSSGLEGASLTKKYAKAVYDVSVDGGESATEYDLGIDLPADAVVTSVLVYINTLFADSGTGSVKLECKGSGDLMAYRDLTASPVNSILFGGISETASTTGGSGPMIPETPGIEKTGYDSILTACSVLAVVRGGAGSGYVPQTAGKFTAVIEYFVK